MATLRDLREDRGVKQKMVAEHLGVSRQTYAVYEREPWRMRGSQIQSVCKFLHCYPADIDDIFLSPDVN